MRFRAELSTLLALLALTPAAFGQGAGGAAPSSQLVPTVLELFTSQGCSSCPAADALLKTFAERTGTMALSFSVDYWDHLGWKDTLASPKYTSRQRAYAKVLAAGNVYTPQIVIDGGAEAVGSNKALIDKAVGRASSAHKNSVGVVAKSDGARVTIDIAGGATTEASATVWWAVVSPRVDVKIKHGENRDKMLSYYNVVREMTPVGMWSGKPMQIELPANAVLGAGNRGAVLLQAGEGGRILGAAWMSP